jgi:uncharacterized phage protein gp47/JayE
VTQYTPRTAQEILRSMAARVVARSGVNDLNEGSVLLHVLASMAEEIAGRERQLEAFVDSFFLDTATGGLLDERAAEFPPDTLARLGPAAASGSVLQLTRADTVGALSLAAGMTFRRSDDPSQLYRTTAAAEWLAGVATTTNDVAVTCTRPGAAGNCGIGKISKIENADDNVIAATNPQGLSNGQDGETDDQLRSRLLAYLGSLARCQPVALEYAALSFRTDDGERVRFAKIWEDPDRRGYSELIVDDGSGMGDDPEGAGGGVSRLGVTATGTVAQGGALLVWHEAPATRPIDVIRVTRAGAPVQLLASDGDFVSIPERGICYIKAGQLQADDVWAISTNLGGDQYRVFTGVIAGLQNRIEGSTSDPTGDPGWRAAGTRVRVRPATVQNVDMTMHIVPRAGITLSDLTLQVSDDVGAYLQSLGPGETLYLAQLISSLISGISGLLSLRIYNSGTTIPLGDVEPLSGRRSLRLGALDVIPSPAE